jgi:hypothetical protein
LRHNGIKPIARWRDGFSFVPSFPQKTNDARVEKLNTQCSGFVTEFGCYACLEINPPQSVIIFKLDSAGVIVTRTFDAFCK